MKTSTLLKCAGVAFVLFVVSDFLWHNVIMADFYIEKITAIGGSMPEGFPVTIMIFNLLAAIAFSYILLLTHPSSASDGLVKGAILGFLMVATVNVVNNMLFPGWDQNLALVDTAWGVVSSAVVGAAVVLVKGKHV